MSFESQCLQFRYIPKVIQVEPLVTKLSSLGMQMGLAKSENNNASSIFNKTTELPSTWDLTIPMIVLFCSHGVLLWSLTVANLLQKRIYKLHISWFPSGSINWGSINWGSINWGQLIEVQLIGVN